MKIINERGEIEYEELGRAADAIESGRSYLNRLLVEAERGRTAGGRRNVEASLILSCSQSADRSTESLPSTRELREIREKQERLIESYARREGIWLDYKEETKREMLDRGREAIVFHREDKVRKIIYPYADAASLLEFLDNKISLGNYLFSKTPYKLIGFTRNRSGSLMVVVEQPYIKHIAKTIRDPDIFESYKMFLTESGWNMDESNTFTIWNDDFIVHDLHEDNILIDELGGFYFIDTSPKLYTSRYGGSRRYGNGELLLSNSGR